MPNESVIKPAISHIHSSRRGIKVTEVHNYFKQIIVFQKESCFTLASRKISTNKTPQSAITNDNI